VAVVAAVQYDKLAIFDSGRHYSAYFTEAGGLTSGAPVHVAGYDVGRVSSVALDGARVKVDFTVDEGIRLGDRTEAAIKTKTLLGSRQLDVSPRGNGELSTPIPTERTTAPYDLTEALGGLATRINDLDTQQLNEALTTVAQTFKDTPADLKAAVDGLSRFSATLGKRDEQLRQLLANANQVTGVLRERTDQIVGLVHNANALLAQLRTQSTALDRISGNIAALSQQVSGFVADNNTQMRPALEKLNEVLTTIDNHKVGLQESIKLLSGFSLSLSEAVSGAPFFKSYIANLIPGEIIQPFIDAASA